jgi:lysine 2,3-aminomutase
MTQAAVEHELAPPVPSLKPPVDPSALEYRNLRSGPWWQRLPGYAEVDEATFLDHKWQARNSITKPQRLYEVLDGVVSSEFVADVEEGFRRANMALRVSPYVVSLIDWENPYSDPLRIQFVPVGSRMLPDHPKLYLDSLGEQADAPVHGLTHRYPDKALFLALDTCPVYCRFCTRSYAVGTDTEQVEKLAMRVNKDRWKMAFAYIQSRPELEDIVISGGDTYQLRPEQVLEIGETLLSFPNIRRLRFATKGPAILPMKLLTHDEWFDALTTVADKGRAMHKAVVVHTHFNHPNEITDISQRALNRLFERGITVRNQCVMQRGVNADARTMSLLVKRLGHINVEPYYVYCHDLVRGVEDLRTTLQTGLEIEKQVRGITAGFHVPTLVVDTQGGGGKRDAHSFEHYDRENGIAVYTSPVVKPGKAFFYYDPIDTLSPEAQARWQDEATYERMIDEAVAAAGLVR